MHLLYRVLTFVTFICLSLSASAEVKKTPDPLFQSVEIFSTRKLMAMRLNSISKYARADIFGTRNATTHRCF
jgi:hypothetical protein